MSIEASGIFAVVIDKSADRIFGGRLPREVGHVKCEEVAGIDEEVNIFEADVVGVNVVWAGVIEALDGGVCFFARHGR